LNETPDAEVQKMLQALEKRRSNRGKVIMPVVCRSQGGIHQTVILSDISAHGCRLYGDAVILHVGQTLTLQPANFEGIAGKVRWIDGLRAGIEFTYPLHSAVAEQMQQLYAVPSHPDTQTSIRVLSASLTSRRH
jgi:hypothetical protein